MAERRSVTPPNDPDKPPPPKEDPFAKAAAGVPTKPNLSLIDQLVQKLGLDLPSAAQVAAPSSSNPASGITDAVGRLMAPVKRSIDWMQGR